jgi:hypothetical protein
VPGTSLWHEIYPSFLFPTHYSILSKFEVAAVVQMRLPTKLSFGKKKTKNTGNILSQNNEARSCNHYCRGKAIIILCILSVCFYIPSHPAFNAHSPYYHLCPVRIYHSLPRYLTNRPPSGTKVIQYKTCVSLFSTTFV